jgi:hypothetical protein
VLNHQKEKENMSSTIPRQYNTSSSGKKTLAGNWYEDLLWLEVHNEESGSHSNIIGNGDVRALFFFSVLLFFVPVCWLISPKKKKFSFPKTTKKGHEFRDLHNSSSGDGEAEQQGKKSSDDGKRNVAKSNGNGSTNSRIANHSHFCIDNVERKGITKESGRRTTSCS